jgi:hypothetical protein
MKVVRNSGFRIFANMWRTYVLSLFCSLFGSIFVTQFVLWVVDNYFINFEASPRFVITTYILSILFFYATFFKSLVTFHRYKLELKDGVLEIRGRGPWRAVNEKKPLKYFTSIRIGEPTHRHDFHHKINGRTLDNHELEALKSRMSFYSLDDLPFHINYATIVFDKQSLWQFYDLLVEEGIEVSMHT